MSSIQEVARQAGVSPATVSRTFRTPGLLSQQTRSRVLDVAARLNYVPRPHGARVEAVESAPEVSGALGFLYFASDLDQSHINEFYAPMIGGAQAEAGRLGLHLIVRTTSRYERPAEMPRMSREQAVAGTLLVGAALPDVLKAFDSPRHPSVLLDNCNPRGHHDCVLSDGFGGALAATQHLLELGHRRIAFFSNEPNAPSFQDRRRGYLCALWEAGVSPDPRWALSTTRQEPLEPHLAPLLEPGPDAVTAVVASNDWNAFNVIKVCRGRGLSVPEDISVVGFDDISFSVHCYPPLTTARVDKDAMGRLAVRRLVSRIEECHAGEPPAPPVRLIAPAALVVRASTAPPNRECA